MESHWYYCLQFTSISLIIHIHFIVLYIFITLFVKMIIRVSETVNVNRTVYSELVLKGECSKLIRLQYLF